MTTHYREPPTVAPLEQISGYCLEASKAAQNDRLRVAADYHAACRPRTLTRAVLPAPVICSCPCHRPPTAISMKERVDAARAARREESGVPEIRPTQRSAVECRNGHRLTTKNTGKRDECLDCRKESRARATATRKANRKARKATT